MIASNTPKVKVLSIAIDRYNDAMFDELYNAVNDSNQLVKVLEEKYLISEISKQDIIHDNEATKSIISKRINELKKELSYDDTLILFWNGHGEVDGDRGFLITNESKKNDTSTWFPYSELLRLLKGITAKHIILMINSCYAGEILKERERGSSLPVSDNSNSRWVFVSGSEKVSDGIKGENSPFAKAIIEFLGRNNTNSSISIRELTKYVKDFIQDEQHTQDPFDTVFDTQNDKGGVFHFQLKETDEDVWNKIKAKPSINDLEDFVSKYQDSKFVVFAEEKLKELQKSRDEWTERLEKFDKDLDYFIKTYEDGEYVKIAQSYKQKVETDIINIKKYKTIIREWEKVRKSNDIDLITQFIKSYEDSGHPKTISRARNLKENLEKELRIKNAWEELERKLKNTTAERRVSDYHYFIRKYKVIGKYYKKASEKINEIEFYIKALKEAKDKYDVTLLKEYLDYPAPIFKRQAQTKIKEIENSKSKETDLEELEKITIKKSIQALESFIQDGLKRNDEVIVDAKGRLDELKKEIKEVFDVVIKSTKPEEFYNFYTTYYDCDKVDIVKQEFFTKEEEFFLEGKRDKNISILERYIKTFQDLEHRYIKDAIELIKEFKKDEAAYLTAEEKNEIVYYDKYLSSFTDGKYREKALNRKDILIKKEEANNLYSKCKKDFLREDLERYKSLYSSVGDNIDDVELMIKELDEKEDEEKRYNEIMSDSGKIEDCEVYIDKCKNEYHKEYRIVEVNKKISNLKRKQEDETAKNKTLNILENTENGVEKIKVIKENYLDVIIDGEYEREFTDKVKILEFQKEECIKYEEATKQANEKNSYDDKIEVWETIYLVKYKDVIDIPLIYLDEAQTILSNLKRDKSDTEFFYQMDKLAQETSTDNEAIGYYNEYLKKYTNGLNTQAANDKILFHQENIKAQDLYDEIINLKSQEVYSKVILLCRDYKINYHHKKHIQDVKEIQETAILRQEEDGVFKNIESNPTQENCGNYIVNKQYKRYNKEVIQYLNNIENGNGLISKSEEKVVDNELINSIQSLAKAVKDITEKQGKTEEILNDKLNKAFKNIMIVFVGLVIVLIIVTIIFYTKT
jgi:hypothetical protein